MPALPTLRTARAFRHFQFRSMTVPPIPERVVSSSVPVGRLWLSLGSLGASALASLNSYKPKDNR